VDYEQKNKKPVHPALPAGRRHSEPRCPDSYRGRGVRIPLKEDSYGLLSYMPTQRSLWMTAFLFGHSHSCEGLATRYGDFVGLASLYFRRLRDTGISLSGQILVSSQHMHSSDHTPAAGSSRTLP